MDRTVKSLPHDRAKRGISVGGFAAAAGVGLLLFTSGCQMMRSGAPVQIPAAETAQDQALSKSVQDKLLAHKREDLTAVDVVSSAGTVYLTGTVGSLDAREQAIKIAWSTPGVKSVVNSLVVEK